MRESPMTEEEAAAQLHELTLELQKIKNRQILEAATAPEWMTWAPAVVGPVIAILVVVAIVGFLAAAHAAGEWVGRPSRVETQLDTVSYQLQEMRRELNRMDTRVGSLTDEARDMRRDVTDLRIEVAA